MEQDSSGPDATLEVGAEVAGRAAYVPKVGDVVTAEFTVTRSRRGSSETRTTWRQVFGQVQHVTPKRVLVQTLKTSAFGFQKNDTWVPRSSVVAASAPQCERWHEAIGDCDALVHALRGAYMDNRNEQDAYDDGLGGCAKDATGCDV